MVKPHQFDLPSSCAPQTLQCLDEPTSRAGIRSAEIGNYTFELPFLCIATVAAIHSDAFCFVSCYKFLNTKTYANRRFLDYTHPSCYPILQADPHTWVLLYANLSLTYSVFLVKLNMNFNIEKTIHLTNN